MSVINYQIKCEGTPQGQQKDKYASKNVDKQKYPYKFKKKKLFLFF
jgi:hypothetical protein